MKHRDKSSIKKYRSPLPERVTTKIVYPTGEAAHENFPESRYAKDFIATVGTPIIAMEGGKVIYVKSDSDKYGRNKALAGEVNTIAIEHKDKTVLEYLHFGKDQIYFKKGDKVKKGQILGLSGLSGYMDTPHVHVNLVEKRDGKYISILYDVKGVYDPRATDKSSRSKKKLENLVGAIFLISIIIALLFFSGITGNVVGMTNNNFYGLIFILVGLVCGGIWIFLEKRWRLLFIYLIDRFRIMKD